MSNTILVMHRQPQIFAGLEADCQTLGLKVIFCHTLPVMMEWCERVDIRVVVLEWWFYNDLLHLKSMLAKQQNWKTLLIGEEPPRELLINAINHGVFGFIDELQWSTKLWEHLQKAFYEIHLDQAKLDLSLQLRQKAQQLFAMKKVLEAEVLQGKQQGQWFVRLSQAIDQCGDRVTITNTLGNIVYVNSSFEIITGYSKREAVGENPRLLNSGSQNNEFYQYLWEAISHGNVFHKTFKNRRKNGTLYYEDQSITPIRDERGIIINYLSIAREVE